MDHQKDMHVTDHNRYIKTDAERGISLSKNEFTNHFKNCY